MKKLFFLLLFTAFSFSGFSQVQNEYLNYRYSLSVNALFTHNLTYGGVYEKTSLIDGLTSSFFIMRANGNEHEISLEKLKIGSSSYYYDSTSLQSNNGVDISVGYKYHFNLIKRKTSKWIPSVGLGAHVFYRSLNFGTTTSVAFPVNYRGGGVQFIVQPKLTYHMNHRVYLNLSIPVNAANMELRSDNIADPSIPEEQRKITRTDVVSFSQIQAKLGVGIKF